MKSSIDYNSTLTWADIGKTRHVSQANAYSPREWDTYAQTALHVLAHLHVKLHLFRHTGETDWATYHLNKPYEFLPSCETRKSSSAAFTWMNQALAPEFCGDSLYAEVGQASCRCALSECAARWKRPAGEGWASGFVPKGLSALAPKGTGGNLFATLGQRLSWSKFNPICTGDSLFDAPFESSFQNDIQAATTSRACFDVNTKSMKETVSRQPTNVEFVSSSSSSEAISNLDSFVGWAKGDPKGNNGVRLCNQRLHRRGRHSYIAGSACGYDAPLFVINHRGMSAPLALCPESFIRFTNFAQLSTVASTWNVAHNREKRTSTDKETYFDDNFMLVALHDLIHRSTNMYEFYSGLKRREKQKKGVPKGNMLGMENVGVLDPLFFQSLNHSELFPLLHSASSSFILDVATSSSASASNLRSSLGVSNSWVGDGFVAQIENRLTHVDLRDETKMILLPIYIAGTWSIGVCVLPSSTSLSQSEPFVIFGSFDSTASLSLQERNYISKTTQAMLVSIMQKDSRANKSFALHHVASAESAKEAPGLASGMRLLFFVDALLTMVEVSKPPNP